jgi:hypothetical protein
MVRRRQIECQMACALESCAPLYSVMLSYGGCLRLASPRCIYPPEVTDAHLRPTRIECHEPAPCCRGISASAVDNAGCTSDPVAEISIGRLTEVSP